MTVSPYFKLIFSELCFWGSVPESLLMIRSTVTSIDTYLLDGVNVFSHLYNFEQDLENEFVPVPYGTVPYYMEQYYVRTEPVSNFLDLRSHMKHKFHTLRTCTIFQSHQYYFTYTSPRFHIIKASLMYR